MRGNSLGDERTAEHIDPLFGGEAGGIEQAADERAEVVG
jgi:hypothetical protein